MTTRYEKIWTFCTAQFRVTFDVAEEYDIDLSYDEDGSIREGLESGKYVGDVSLDLPHTRGSL